MTASNGEEGFKLAKSQQPSVILLDVVMPKLNGLDIYKLLRSDSNTCSIPIIFVTAMTRMEKIIKAQITEDVEVIVKLFDLMTLASQVVSECDRYLICRQFNLIRQKIIYGKDCQIYCQVLVWQSNICRNRINRSIDVQADLREWWRSLDRQSLRAIND